MASAKKHSAAEYAAMYGHIGHAVREAMIARSLSPTQLNQAMGRDAGNGAIYLYINGKGAPTGEAKAMLMRILELPEEALTRRSLTVARAGKAEPGTALVRVPAAPKAVVAAKSPEVLSFAIMADGTARLGLDVTQPADQGIALLQLLLAGGNLAKAVRRTSGE
jgi:hypothetical protein